MEDINCPYCKSTHTVKNGSVKGTPKRKCKDCGKQYSRAGNTNRASSQQKHTGILLYINGLSINAIAKLLGFSTPAVLYWIKQFGRKHCPKPQSAHCLVMELDEMWHYLQKNSKMLDMEGVLPRYRQSC